MSISSAPEQPKLASIFIQTILYVGIYATLFLTITSVLLWKRPVGRLVLSDKVGVLLLMLLIATLHAATSFSRILLAFVIHVDTRGGPSTFFDRLSSVTQMLGSTLYMLQTLLGDSVVLYRCYLVWERRKTVIALPALSFLCSAATAIGMLGSFTEVIRRAPALVKQPNGWISTFFCLTIATNVLCTALVAYRVWELDYDHLTFRHRNVRPVLVLIVKSGALYSATLSALIIIYNADTWYQDVVLDAVSPVIGIMFSVIMLRISTGLASVGGEAALALSEPKEGVSGVSWRVERRDTIPHGSD